MRYKETEIISEMDMVLKENAELRNVLGNLIGKLTERLRTAEDDCITRSTDDKDINYFVERIRSITKEADILISDIDVFDV